MENFISYIEKSLPKKEGDKILYKFKKKILDEMTQRANEITARGLKDENVVNDLIISEYPNLDLEYKKFYQKETSSNKAKKQIVFNTVASIIFIFVLLIVFLSVSFLTHAWEQTWVIMVDGILLWVAYLLSLVVKKFTSMRKIFHIIARLFLAGAVIVVAVAVFLFALIILQVPHSWLIVIGGIASMFIADTVYITVTKQKLAILSYLAYIPATTAMVYIILGVLSIVPWSPGWLMIPLSLIIDAVIVAVRVAKNAKISQEVSKQWNED